MNRKLIAVTFILSSYLTSHAQQIEPFNKEDRAAATRVDRVVKAAMSTYKIPGVSLAVLRNGKIILLKSYGLANVEHQVPVKPETIFQSGSIGKQFTAAAIMILAQENKLSLDDKVSKYFPDAPASWKDITVWNLLTHTSGLGDYPPDIDLRRDYTEEQFFESFKKAPLEFAPGTNWNYSNVGYVTLGILIRKVTGKYYGDFLQERVFRPLGMTTARVISEEDIISNRASGYRLVNGELKNQEWVSPSTNSTADGSLYFSILDMAKWDAALYTDTPLTQASRNRIWTPAQLSDGTTKGYGFGWHILDLHGHRLIVHGGAWQGFKSFIARYPDNNLTVILFANSSNTNPARLANHVAEIIDPRLRPNTIIDPDPKFTAELRQLLAGVLKGEVDIKRFAPAVGQALADPNDRLIAHMKTIGPIQKFELLERNVTDAGVLYRYSAEFGSMTVNLLIRVGKDGRIDRFELNPD